MEKQGFIHSLPFKLLVALAVGICLGLGLSGMDNGVSHAILNIVVTVKYIAAQFISFCVPLIIIGFIAPSITRLGNNASRMLIVALFIAYVSSIGAAFFATFSGYTILPHLNINPDVDGLKELPEVVFQLSIPQIMPVLPLLIGTTFCTLAYEGTITKQLPIFLIIIIIVMIGHYIWLTLLYSLAGAYAKKNPMNVLKHYGPAYMTAVGTMSSAATLSVALECAKKSEPTIREDMVDFGIPLFANIHLCGSVMTETFFVMAVSKMLYNEFPSVEKMILFCLLLGVFAIGAPGVPGGTVMASLGLITGVLGFDETGTALMLTIFALQDSFGTACNVTGDGALALILTGYAEKHGIHPQKLESVL